MKRISLLLSALLLILTINAQSPDKFNYQAIIRNTDGSIRANQNVNIQIEILQGSISGSSSYVETHTVTSTAQGLVNLVIGNGTVVSGSLSNIDWSAGPFFLKIGVNGEEMGTSQLLSVPFAKYAERAGNVSNGSVLGDMMYWNGSKWSIIPVGKQNQYLSIDNGVPKWTSSAIASIPTVAIIDSSNLLSQSASYSCIIYSDGGSLVTTRGICWNTIPNPTIDNFKTSDGIGFGNYTSNLTDLEAGRIYYLRAYATNNAGTAYSPQVTYKTSAGISTLITTIISNIRAFSAVTGGNITSDGGSAVIARGICWSTDTNPTLNDNFTLDGSGSGIFTSNISGLTRNTTYYIKAYATNNIGTSYGNLISFNTKSGIASISTNQITSIMANSATSGGQIADDGGDSITVRGVCWDNSHNPDITKNKTNDGKGMGTFTSTISELNSDSTYFVRAYAINSTGIVYGDEKSFVSLPVGVTVNDIDGNVYQAATIGTQIWMSQNLMTTHFNDSSTITFITDSASWYNSTSPAYCWYQFAQNINNAGYGAYYNWYTVNTQKLCPSGWRVPSDSDWTVLTSYLGGETVAGGKLKQVGTVLWWSPNIGATDDYGFTALPAGSTNPFGYDSPAGYASYWWTSTSTTAQYAWFRFLYSSSKQVGRDQMYIQDGYSVRCIKN